MVSAGARAEDTLSVATWGGAYGQSQEIAYFEPFAKETGTRIATEVYDGTLAKIKEMIGGSESSVDVVDVSAATLGTLCSDGLLETIEASSLGAAPTGESAELDFYSGGLSSCGVGSVAWSTAIAFDRQAFPKTQPSQIADLIDPKRFAGKRALPNGPRYTLELALLADGVDPANVYTELATPEGADRAFKALDKIKGDIFWWDNAQEPITWLLEKKVGMAAGYSGRIFRAAVGDRQRLGVVWDGQIYDLDLWAIPKGAKNKDGAMRFISLRQRPRAAGDAGAADRLRADAEIGAGAGGQAPDHRRGDEGLSPDGAGQFQEGASIRRCLVERARCGSAKALRGVARAAFAGSRQAADRSGQSARRRAEHRRHQSRALTTRAAAKYFAE